MIAEHLTSGNSRGLIVGAEPKSPKRLREPLARESQFDGRSISASGMPHQGGRDDAPFEGAARSLETRARLAIDG